MSARADNLRQQEAFKLKDFGPRRKLVMATAKRHHRTEESIKVYHRHLEEVKTPQVLKRMMKQEISRDRKLSGPGAWSDRTERPADERACYQEGYMLKYVHPNIVTGPSGVRLKDHPLADDRTALRAKLAWLRSTYKDPESAEAQTGMSRIIGICPKDLERLGWGRK